MRGFIYTAVLAAVVWGATPSPRAQAFPLPGTGPFTWERVGGQPLSIHKFSFLQNGDLIGSKEYAYVIDRSSGGIGGQWRLLGPRPVDTQGLVSITGRLDTLLASSRGAVLERTVNGGASWSLVLGSTQNGIASTTNGEVFYLIPPGRARAGRIVAGAGPQSGISYSDDRGATWQLPDLSTFPLTSGGFVDFLPSFFRGMPSGRILAGGNWGVATSDDDGSAWAPTPIFDPYHYLVYAMDAIATPGSSQTGAPACGLADPARCDGAIALGIDSTVPHIQAWRTNDGGRSWSAPVPLPEPNDGIGAGYAAAVVPLGSGSDGLGRALAILGRGVIYGTGDGGQSWTAIGRLPVTLDYNWVRGARLGPDGHLWVGTFNAGPNPGWLLRSVEPASAAFAVAGEAGPSEATTLGVSVRPNPAGGRVEVVVTLAEASSVRVAVVDALGREVAVVLDGAVAQGERVVGVDTASWPPGVYVVRVTAGARLATARLVVAR